MPRPILERPTVRLPGHVETAGETVTVRFAGRRLNQVVSARVRYVNANGDTIYIGEEVTPVPSGNAIEVSFRVPESNTWSIPFPETTEPKVVNPSNELEVTVVNNDGDEDTGTYP